jgi:hypothetical protein
VVAASRFPASAPVRPVPDPLSSHARHPTFIQESPALSMSIPISHLTFSSHSLTYGSPALHHRGLLTIFPQSTYYGSRFFPRRLRAHSINRVRSRQPGTFVAGCNLPQVSIVYRWMYSKLGCRLLTRFHTMHTQTCEQASLFCRLFFFLLFFFSSSLGRGGGLLFLF